LKIDFYELIEKKQTKALIFYALNLSI